MAVNTGIDKSSSSREAAKGFYWKPLLTIADPDSAISITYEKIDNSGNYKVDRNNVPWASQVETAMLIGTTGYTGDIPTASGTMTVVNGVITAYS